MGYFNYIFRKKCCEIPVSDCFEGYHEAGWFTDIPMPEEMTDLKARRIVSSPFGFSEMSPEYIPTKGFGAWNHEIIGELGYTPEQIDELQEKWKQAMAKN